MKSLKELESEIREIIPTPSKYSYVQTNDGELVTINYNGNVIGIENPVNGKPDVFVIRLKEDNSSLEINEIVIKLFRLLDS